MSEQRVMTEADLDSIDYAYCPDSEYGDADSIWPQDAPTTVCTLTASHRALQAENEQLRDALLIVANQLPPASDVPFGKWVYARVQVYGQDLQAIADALRENEAKR